MYKPANPIAFADTRDMQLTINGYPVYQPNGLPALDEKKWLNARKTGIGGSDTSIICGINQFRSLHNLYDDKVGVAPAVKKEPGIATKIGHMFEYVIKSEVVPYLFSLQGIHLQKGNCGDACWGEDSRMFRHGNPEYNFALADLDGWIKLPGKGCGILEIKTTNPRNKDVIDNYWKKGIIPPYYKTQLIHYMAVTNLNYAYICCAWGLNPEEDAILLCLERDMKAEVELMEKEKAFWENVQLRIEPPETAKPSVTLDYEKRRYRASRSEKGMNMQSSIQLFVERESIENELQLLSSKLKEKEEELALIDATIYQQMGAEAYGYAKLSATTGIDIYTDNTFSNQKVNVESLKSKYPNLYEKYKTISIPLSKIKGEDRAKVNECLEEKTITGRSISVYLNSLDKNGKVISGSRIKTTSSSSSSLKKALLELEKQQVI